METAGIEKENTMGKGDNRKTRKMIRRKGQEKLKERIERKKSDNKKSEKKK
jgi:hypothetical protein